MNVKEGSAESIFVGFDGKAVIISAPHLNNYITGGLVIPKTYAPGLGVELNQWLFKHHQFNYMIPNLGMRYVVIFTSGYSIIDGLPILVAYMLCPGWETLVVYFSDQDVVELNKCLLELFNEN